MADRSLIEAHTFTLSGCWVVLLTGVLDGTTCGPVRDLLIKLAIDQPNAVIVDVDELSIGEETALTAFSSAWTRVSEWPGVPIVLVAGEVGRRTLLTGTISRRIPFHATVAEAVLAARGPGVDRRASLDLESGAMYVRATLNFVWNTCRGWSVTGPFADIMAIACELVDNVRRHAGTGCQVRLELRQRTLVIAVWDGSVQPAVVRERVSEEPGGNGLRLVADRARTWGCVPHLHGGKVVWALLPCDVDPSGLG